jgi:hypothetical protein
MFTEAIVVSFSLIAALGLGGTLFVLYNRRQARRERERNRAFTGQLRT